MTSLDDLEAYFGGRCVGDMGLRSWLGRWADFGPVRGGQTVGASAPDPAGEALAAARTMNRVEGALDRIGPEHARVLEGYYSPLAPCARGTERLGAIAGVVGVLPREVLVVLRSLHERRVQWAAERAASSREHVRLELRCGTDEGARAELELMPLLVADPFDPIEAIQALLTRPGRDPKRILRRIETAANVALSEAKLAYMRAVEQIEDESRVARRHRFSVSMGIGV